MGFGIMMSVVTNNVAALAALANGMLPLRKIAALQAESQLDLENKRRSHGLAAAAHPDEPALLEVVNDGETILMSDIADDSAPILQPGSSHSELDLGRCYYQRPLRRPFDDRLRDAILVEAASRVRELPLALKLAWHPTEPILTARATMVTINLAFRQDTLGLYAHLPLAMRLMVTSGNRNRAIEVFEEVASQFDL